jgi:hypothetical protein
MPVSQSIHTKKNYVFKAGTLINTVERLGVRAEDFYQALTDSSEMRRQKVQIDKPTIMIETAKVIHEGRQSAKDMALFEALLAIARYQGMKNSTCTVHVSTLMNFLRIESLDRLCDALLRISETLILFDFREEGTRQRRRKGRHLIQLFDLDNQEYTGKKGHVRERLERDSATLTYTVSDEIRQLYLAPRTYTYLSLAAISQFGHMYANAIYQMLAVKVTHDEHMRTPLVISAKKLAEKIGWSFGSGPFKATLFMERVVRPVLQDFRDQRDLIGFEVAFKEPVRQAGHGRPLSDLEFTVVPWRESDVPYSQADASRRRRGRIKQSVKEAFEKPDPWHSRDCFPSLARFAAVCHRLRMQSGYLGFNESLAGHHNSVSIPSDLNARWRHALDIAHDNPDETISYSMVGFEILAALGDPRSGGIDVVFERWAMSEGRCSPKRTRVLPTRKETTPYPEARLLPDQIYQHFWIMLGHTEEEKPNIDVLRSYFSSGVYWGKVAAAAPDQVKLGGLTRAIQLLAHAHPVRIVTAAKGFGRAIVANDFEHIERVMKSVFSNEKTLSLDFQGRKYDWKRSEAAEQQRLFKDSLASTVA